jgi:hypothetical protein
MVMIVVCQAFVAIRNTTVSSYSCGVTSPLFWIKQTYKSHLKRLPGDRRCPSHLSVLHQLKHLPEYQRKAVTASVEKVRFVLIL